MGGRTGTTFRLIWLDRAIAELSAIYLARLATSAGDAVVRASARVDQVLAPNPTGAGESRTGHERVMFEPPLTVYYEVHDDERVVVVTSVRYSGRE